MKRENPDGSEKHIIYKEEFRRQAVEMVIHSGKTQAQVARELGCSEYSLNLWKKAYLRQQAPAEIDGQQRSPEQMFGGDPATPERKRVSQTAARDPISGAVNRESGKFAELFPPSRDIQGPAMRPLFQIEGRRLSLS